MLARQAEEHVDAMVHASGHSRSTERTWDAEARRREAQTAVARAGAYLREGRMEQAEAALNRALLLDPASAEAIAVRALLTYRRGELVEAERLAREAITLLPADGALRRTLGSILEDLGQAQGVNHRQGPEQLLAATPAAEIPQPEQRVVLPQPRGPSGQTVMAGSADQTTARQLQAGAPIPAAEAGGRHSIRMGAPDDAVAALEERVRAMPDDRRLRRELSTAYLRAGRLAEAREQLQRAEQLLGRRGLHSTPR